MGLFKKKLLKEEKIIEIDLLKNKIKKVKLQQKKILLALSNLEGWFAQGKIDYKNYQKRKSLLLKSKIEHEVYLYRTSKKLAQLNREIVN